MNKLLNTLNKAYPWHAKEFKLRIKKKSSNFFIFTKFVFIDILYPIEKCQQTR